MTNIPIPDSGGVWTMTDAEFKRELSAAWDDGMVYGTRGQSRNQEDFDTNPYRSQT